MRSNIRFDFVRFVLHYIFIDLLKFYLIFSTVKVVKVIYIYLDSTMMLLVTYLISRWMRTSKLIVLRHQLHMLNVGDYTIHYTFFTYYANYFSYKLNVRRKSIDKRRWRYFFLTYLISWYHGFGLRIIFS